MKRILFIILVASFFSGPANAQLNVWRWQNPVPVGSYLYAVQMVSLQTIYACGENGSFMSTSDGGLTWNTQSNVLKIKATLRAISFINPNYGYCAGDSGRIMKTTDGGATWKLLNAAVNAQINGILALDQNIVIIVLGNGAIIRSTDGGTTWTNLPSEGFSALLSIRELNPNFLSITGVNGALLTSTDQGATWNAVRTGIGNNIFSAVFTDDQTATLIGDNAVLIHTTDGGFDWTSQSLLSLQITANLNVIDGKDPNVLAIVGDHATLLYTKDGGKTWNVSFLPGTLDPIKGLSFFDKLTATAVGRNGLILHTTDGGVTWAFQPKLPYTEILHGIGFPRGDTSLAIAVGENGAIMRTTSGGKDWTTVASNVSGILYGVSFADESHVVAVGAGGTILKSNDSGLTWSRVQSGTSADLYGISFSTPNAGVIAGDGATIMTTTTAGQFWTFRHPTNPTTSYFNSVSAPDSLHAFICGSGGVYRTLDGGINWDLAPGAQYSTGRCISFADSLHGGFCNSDKYVVGYVCSTSDGGNTFDSIYADPNAPGFTSICYSDRQHATVVGNFGAIYHTTNYASKVWFAQASNTPNTLNGVAFGSVKAGNAVGTRGNIMRITSDDKLGVHPVSATAVPGITIGNFPNPFSAETTIQYNLLQAGRTEIEIFSIDGKSVAVFTTDYQGSGDHSVNFDGSHLASGAYLIKITSGGLSASKQVVVQH
jgi:photosystem II stability/assembly factor-like uncharacterized protein